MDVSSAVSSALQAVVVPCHSLLGVEVAACVFWKAVER